MNHIKRSDIEEMKKQVKMLKSTVKIYETMPGPKPKRKSPSPPVKYKVNPVDRLFSDDEEKPRTSNQNKQPNRISTQKLEKAGNFSLFTKQELINTVNQYKQLVSDLQKRSISTIEELTVDFKKEKEAVITKLSLKKSKIKRLNKEIEELKHFKAKSDAQREEINGLKEINSLLAEDVRKLGEVSSELDRSKKDSRTLKRRIFELEREIESGKKKIRFKDKAINKKEEANKLEKEKQQDFFKETEKLKNELFKLAEEKKSEAEIQNKIIKNLQRENKKLQINIKKSVKEKNDVEEELRNQADQFKSDMIGSATVEVELARERTANKYHGEKIIAQSESIKELTNKIETLSETIKDKENTIKSLNSTIKEKDSLLEFKTNLIEHTQTKNRNFEKTVDGFKKKEAEYLNEYEGFIKKYDGVCKELGKVKEEMGRVEEENEIYRSRSIRTRERRNSFDRGTENKNDGNFKRVKQLEEINSMIVQFRRSKLN